MRRRGRRWSARVQIAADLRPVDPAVAIDLDAVAEGEHRDRPVRGEDRLRVVRPACRQVQSVTQHKADQRQANDCQAARRS